MRLIVRNKCVRVESVKPSLTCSAFPAIPTIKARNYFIGKAGNSMLYLEFGKFNAKLINVYIFKLYFDRLLSK
jgi:hypothetical protein